MPAKNKEKNNEKNIYDLNFSKKSLLVLLKRSLPTVAKKFQQHND